MQNGAPISFALYDHVSQKRLTNNNWRQN